jgi:outer membrane protein assembly factor BamB
MFMLGRTSGAACAAAVVLCAASAWGAVTTGATGWRGPGRDGRVPGFQAPANWPEALTQDWRVEVGEGHSSPLIVEDAAFIFSRNGEAEVVRRLDVETGREVWKASYPAPYEMNPAARGHGKGPKSTPAWADGRLYTFGITGILSCLDATSGEVLWRHSFEGKHKTTSPLFGAAMSPLVDGDLVYAHVGGHDDGALAAFDARTGATRWSWTGDGPAYSSPILVTVEGVRTLVTQTQQHCVGLDAATGTLLWSLPFTTPYDQNSVSPVAVGELLVFGGTRQPTFAVRPRREGDTWTVEKVWETPEVTLYMSTPVLSGGLLWGMSERQRGQLFSLHPATGEVLWTGEGRFGDNAALLEAGDFILVLSTDADLHVLRVAGDRLDPVARYEAARSAPWASPAVEGHRILIKDFDSLTLWRLAP